MKQLSEEIKVKIRAEAEHRYKNLWHKGGPVLAYTAGAEKYALEAERLKIALQEKIEKHEHRDFKHLGPEAEAVIAAVYQGAASWQDEYDAARKLLAELLDLKQLKDAHGKTTAYLDRQPKAWDAVAKFLDNYQHHENNQNEC